MAKQPLEIALHTLLRSGQTPRTQEELSIALQKVGFDDISQSTLSRLLRKIGAVKTTTVQGHVAYQISREPMPLTFTAPLSALILDVVANETLICIYTHPGAASLVGRMLDYYKGDLPLLGTLAGDDTLLVLPRSTADIPHLLKRLQEIHTL